MTKYLGVNMEKHKRDETLKENRPGKEKMDDKLNRGDQPKDQSRRESQDRQRQEPGGQQKQGGQGQQRHDRDENKRI
jgi:hypothetical protein